MSIDKTALLNDEGKPISANQNSFIKKFNESGRIMIAAPDVYEAGKSGDKDLIKSLQEDFNSWLCVSTRISYKKDSLEGAIAHYFGSNAIEPNEIKVIIPVYTGATLDAVLKEEQGLIYMQALFNTNDDSNKIKDTLQKLSDVSSSKTKIWVPDKDSRKNLLERAVFFNFNVGDFRVDGFDLVDNSNGRSRGVCENPAGVALKNYNAKAKDDNIPYDLNPIIDKNLGCVYFSDIKNIGSLNRYNGLFCFHNKRYIVSLTAAKSNNNYDKIIGNILADNSEPKEILGKIDKEFSPLYAHLLKYEKENDVFISTGGALGIGEPRIKIK